MFRLSREKRIFEAATRATRGEEEPVHEYAVAVVVGVVGEESMPLVLLLAAAIAGATKRPRRAAHLLMHGLLEVLRVHDGPHLAVVVGGPEGRRHFGARLARVDLGFGVGFAVGAGETRLAPRPARVLGADRAVVLVNQRDFEIALVGLFVGEDGEVGVDAVVQLVLDQEVLEEAFNENQGQAKNLNPLMSFLPSSLDLLNLEPPNCLTLRMNCVEAGVCGCIGGSGSGSGGTTNEPYIRRINFLLSSKNSSMRDVG